jgi:hypothetical protein
MKLYQILPTLLMIQMFLASIPCAFQQQWGQALYWFSAGLLNLAIIYMM